MTVCVAAICDGGVVVGASDRMLTSGDVEFEPNIPKIRVMSQSCVVMIAGDAVLHAEIVPEVIERNKQRVEQTNDWTPIRTIAKWYKEELDSAVRRLAVARLLTPFGLTMEDFLTRQKDLSPSFVETVQTEILNFASPAVEALVTGVDHTGAHIFSVTNTSFQCLDTIGFAVIGGGVWHASSQMMIYEHTFRTGFPDTVMSVAFAKKRAEIAPGVGTATDMYCVTGLGGYTLISPKIVHDVEILYEDEKVRQQESVQTCRQAIGDYFNHLVAVTEQQGRSPTVPAAIDSDSSPAVEEGT